MALAELFSDATNEVLASFKGVIPKSFWININVISNKNNVLFTNKWGPPISANDDIKWTYT